MTRLEDGTTVRAAVGEKYPSPLIYFRAGEGSPAEAPWRHAGADVLGLGTIVDFFEACGNSGLCQRQFEDGGEDWGWLVGTNLKSHGHRPAASCILTLLKFLPTSHA